MTSNGSPHQTSPRAAHGEAAQAAQHKAAPAGLPSEPGACRVEPHTAEKKRRETFWRAATEQVAEGASDPGRPAVHNQVLGRFGERLAEQHFLDLGARLLERNYRIACGEIDLLFEHEGDLVAVEVKTRDVEDPSHPLEVLAIRQLRRIAQALTTWAQANAFLERSMRIDLVAIRLAPDGAVEDFEHVRSVYPG